MEQCVKRSQRDYSLAFKLSVVAQVERGELTYKKAQKHYGIQGRTTVLVWMRKHSTLDWRKLIVPKPTKVARPMNEPPTPEQRIKALETQLLAAQQKAQLFEAMVEIVRKQYPQVPVKKCLGKLSKAQSKVAL
jgi:transposase